MNKYSIVGYLPSGAPFDSLLVSGKGAQKDSRYVLQRAKLEELPESQQRLVINSATVLQGLANSCPHQVLCLESFMDPTGYACSVLEYCEVGPVSLVLEQVKKKEFPLAEAEVVSWASEIALAVHHLHERGMIHLNIGVHSVFICADGQAKLGDFALASQLAEGEDTMEPAAISFSCLPPEILRLEPVGRPADIWALGCLIYQLAALRAPFDVAEGAEGQIGPRKTAPPFSARDRTADALCAARLDFEASLASITTGGAPRLPANHVRDGEPWSEGLQQLVAAMLSPAPADRAPPPRPSSSQPLVPTAPWWLWLQGRPRRLWSSRYTSSASPPARPPPPASSCKPPSRKRRHTATTLALTRMPVRGGGRGAGWGWIGWRRRRGRGRRPRRGSNPRASASPCGSLFSQKSNTRSCL